MLKDILKTLKFGAISSTALVFFLSGSETRAQSGSDAFVSFDQFCHRPRLRSIAAQPC